MAQLDYRVCPGRQFALRTLFLNIACTLAVFDISAPVGEKLEAKYKEGFVRWVVVSDPYIVTHALFGNGLMFF